MHVLVKNHIFSTKNIFRESSSEYQILQFTMDSISSGVLAVDAEENITLFNRAAEVILGIKREDALGQKIYDISHIRNHYRHYQCPLVTTIRTLRELSGYEHEIYTSTGKIHLSSDTSLFWNEAGQIMGAVCIFKDITNQKKQAEKRLLEKQIEVLGRLAASTAHEIKNPLASVKGFLQLICEKYTVNEDYLDIMFNEVERMSEIIDDFLLLTKSHHLNPQPCNINILLVKVLHQFQPLFDKYQIKVLKRLTPQKTVAVIDQKQISIAMENIIKNAIHAMSDGGVLAVVTRPVGNKICIEFSDTGPGIPSNNISRIFEPFYSTKDGVTTGLGLTVTHQILHHHDGFLEVDSVEGRGTTMRIFLPAK